MTSSSHLEPGQMTRMAGNALKISISVAFMLVLTKAVAALFTHSLSVAASALDSLMDLAVSLVNFIALKEASKPPDADHAYGHGKIESLASLFQSTFIGLSGLYLVVESVRRVFTGGELAVIPVGVGVMVFSMAATGLLVMVLKRSAERTQSMIVATERLHFTTDLVANGGVIIALVLVRVTGMILWDLAVSILVAVSIFRLSYRIFRRSVDELLDRGLPEGAIQNIKQLILSFDPSIAGLHNFRSRRVGGKIFLDFHVEIRGEDDFKRAHLMTESLITRIQKRFPGADVTVHYDPEGED